MASTLLKWSLYLGIPVVIAGVVAFFLLLGLQQVTVEEVKITNIKGLSLTGFELEGELLISNPSQIDVPISRVEYELRLKETGEVIGESTIPEFVIRSKDLTTVPFSQEFRWGASSQLAVDLLRKDTVLVEVSGIAFVDISNGKEYEVEFKETMDLKEYFSSQGTETPIPLLEQESNPILGIFN